jgi:DNA-binding GntR family transcriptional regulator
LVQKLGVSQTPIKEAFMRLESEGLVVIIPRRGAMVRQMSLRDVKEVFEIREMLESLASRLTARNAKEEDMVNLKSINERFRKAALVKDVKECIEEDCHFHEMLYKYSNNNKLSHLMTQSNLHLLSIAESSPNFFEISDNYYRHHDNIIKAIIQHDEEMAEKSMRDHINYAKEQILAALGSAN